METVLVVECICLLFCHSCVTHGNQPDYTSDSLLLSACMAHVKHSSPYNNN